MTDLPTEAIQVWAEDIAFIRENGQQVTYSDDMVPAVKQRHDDMLRALLAWHRAACARTEHDNCAAKEKR